ncbi:MBL fold metallo-hydrolase [Piscinibacter sakaiensis]|uniref:MBL fold metallo-hydrolase n=1 Tax=Piscinibacter sakaiensis TaxID=1547922 RepID=UPI003AAB0BA8
MSIRVLGCSGAIAAGCRTTAFLLDEGVLIDAGTGVGDLTLGQLARIEHICISHSHLDHVVSIALLADAVMNIRGAAGRGPVTVHALPATIAALRDHIFNGIIWPDFTRLPSTEQPVLDFAPFEVGDRLQLCGREIEVLPAAHTVPAVGFAIRGKQGYWVFTGDTGPNPALWKRLAGLDVHFLVIETAFGNDDLELAQVSGHLCPSQLQIELASLAPGVLVYVTHIKPGERTTVMAELAELAVDQRLDALQIGQVMNFG